MVVEVSSNESGAQAVVPRVCQSRSADTTRAVFPAPDLEADMDHLDTFHVGGRLWSNDGPRATIKWTTTPVVSRSSFLQAVCETGGGFDQPGTERYLKNGRDSLPWTLCIIWIQAVCFRVFFFFGAALRQPYSLLTADRRLDLLRTLHDVPLRDGRLLGRAGVCGRRASGASDLGHGQGIVLRHFRWWSTSATCSTTTARSTLGTRTPTCT